MADLDTLQIQISASTHQADTAISKLQSALAKLNAALSNYADASSYVKGLANLTSGLNNMADAVDRIDTAKIQGISKAIGSLATSGGKLSGLTISKTLTSMGQAAEASSARTKKAVDEITRTFSISSKEGIAELTGAVDHFYEVIDDPAAAKIAENNIRDIINSYAEFGKVVDETKQAVRDWVSNSNLFLNKDTVKEMGDDFARLRGIIGIKNTNTTDLTHSVGLDTFVEEMNQALGLSIQWGDTVQEIASNLANYLAGGSDESEAFQRYALESAEHAEMLSDALDRLYESMGRIREQEATAPKEERWLGAGYTEGDFDFGDVPFEMEEVERASDEMRTSVDRSAESVARVKEELSEEIGNPFEGIVNGISSLVGLEITADQFSGVKTLSDSLGKLSGKNVPIAAQNLPAIAQGLQMVSTVTIPEGLGEQLISLGAAVGKLGGKYATNAQGLIKVAEGITALSAASSHMPDIAALRELASAISVFGRQSAGNAITNLPALASGFRNLINTLATAPAVSQNVIDLANSLARLAAAGGKTGTSAVKGASGLNLFSKSAKGAKKHFTSLAATFGRLYANFFLVIRAARLFKKAIDVSSALREVQNVVATTFGDATGRVQEFADTAIQSFGMSELSAKQYASRFQAMGVAMGITSKQVAAASDFIAKSTANNERSYKNLGDSMADVSINLTKLTADMASFYNQDYADVAEDMAAVMTGMTRPLRKYGLDLTEATLKEWALANGLDGDIKKMTQAQKTMLRYQYVMANMGHVMGDFEKTADTWANVTRTIGQQFEKLGQVIGQALINTFKPALIGFRDFMNTVIDLAVKALNALGKLLGWQIEIEDVGVTLDDGMEDYADSIDDATGSAKKLLKTLLPIDELNVLSDNNGGGGSDVTGGGGASGGIATGGGLSIKPYESDVENWFDFGQRIRDALVRGLTLDWNEIEGKVNTNAARLAFLLNGIFSPDENGDYVLGQKIGEFIANTINMGFRWLYMFSSTLEWEDIGNTISTGINTFFETWDPELAADALSSLSTGILKMMTTAIEGVDWEDAGAKLMEFFMEVDWAEIWTDLSDLIVAIFNAIKSAVKGAIEMAKKDPQAFGEAVLNFSGIALLLGGMKLTKALLTKKVASMLSTMLGTTGASTTAAAAGGASLGTLGTLALLIEAAIVWDYASGNQEERIDQLEDALTKDAETEKEREIGQNYAMQLGTAYTSQDANAATSMYLATSALEKIKEKVKALWDSITGSGEEAATSTANNVLSIENVVGDMSEKVGVDMSNVEKFVTTTSSIANATSAQEWTSIRNTIDGNMSSASTSTQTYSQMMADSIAASFGTASTDTSTKFSEISTTVGTEMSNASTSVSTELDNMDKSVKAFEWHLPEMKLPHLSWDADGKEATGFIKDILEAFGLPAKLPKLNVEWYASGGYPTPGSLFVAGEAGAEMVGSIGGRTGVASNGEITGIASAIYETASQTNALLRGVISTIEQKETGISQEALFASVRSSAKSYRMRTGADAFV